MPLTVNADMPDVLPSWFRSTPSGKQMIAEAEADTLQKRQELRKQLDGLDDGDREINRLEREAKAVGPQIEKAQQRVQELEQKATGLWRQRRSLIVSRDRRLDKLQGELRRTAHPGIVEAIGRLQRHKDALRATCHNWTETDWAVVRDTPGHPTYQKSNAPQIATKLAEVDERISELESLRLAAIPTPEVEKRLTELVEHLPSLE